MDLLNDCVLIQMTPHFSISHAVFFFLFLFLIVCSSSCEEAVLVLFPFVPPHMEHLGEFQLLYFGFSCLGLAN